jgi:hypothetical protein
VSLYQRWIRASDAQTLADALADAENTLRSLSHALAPQYEVRTA